MLTCRKETGITKPEDFKGKTLGVWFAGNEYPFLSWMSTLGLKTAGGADGVTVLKQGFNVDPAAAEAGRLHLHHDLQRVLAGDRRRACRPSELVVFKYEDQGVATLEDGIYTLEKNLKDPAMVDKLARFVKASMKGWDWAVANPDEAAMIVLKNDETGAQTEKHQKRMMGEIAKLVGKADKGTGYLDPAAYDRTVKILLAGGSDPVISKAPEGAWTHDIWEKAMAQ